MIIMLFVLFLFLLKTIIVYIRCLSVIAYLVWIVQGAENSVRLGSLFHQSRHSSFSFQVAVDLHNRSIVMKFEFIFKVLIFGQILLHTVFLKMEILVR